MFLALDTSAGVSVAVYDPDNHMVYGEQFVAGGRHTEQLMPIIDDVLGHTAIVRQALTAICVGTGPGPFTGLRVGLSTARTLGFALGVPVHGVCSLEALAYEALVGAITPEGTGAPTATGVTTLGVAIDARRKEVYFAAYSVRAGSGGVPTLECILPPSVAKPEAAAAALQAAGADAVVGAGVGVYPEAFAGFATVSGPEHAHAGVLAHYAQLCVAAGADLSDTTPLYLRQPDAVEPGARKSALGPR